MKDIIKFTNYNALWHELKKNTPKREQWLLTPTSILKSRFFFQQWYMELPAYSFWGKKSKMEMAKEACQDGHIKMRMI